MHMSMVRCVEGILETKVSVGDVGELLLLLWWSSVVVKTTSGYCKKGGATQTQRAAERGSS